MPQLFFFVWVTGFQGFWEIIFVSGNLMWWKSSNCYFIDGNYFWILHDWLYGNHTEMELWFLWNLVTYKYICSHASLGLDMRLSDTVCISTNLVNYRMRMWTSGNVLSFSLRITAWFWCIFPQTQSPPDPVTQFARGYEDYLQCPLQVYSHFYYDLISFDFVTGIKDFLWSF